MVKKSKVYVCRTCNRVDLTPEAAGRCCVTDLDVWKCGQCVPGWHLEEDKAKDCIKKPKCINCKHREGFHTNNGCSFDSDCFCGNFIKKEE